MRNCILVQLIDLGVDFESKLLISVEYLLANAEAFPFDLFSRPLQGEDGVVLGDLSRVDFL